MKKIYIYVSLIFLIFFDANSEIVKEINITGNKRVSNETIKLYGDIKINQDYSDKDLNRILKNLYETKFFDDVKVFSFK